MPASPFLTYKVQGKKDALRLRHKARQIAHLLRFDVPAQACIAAATFFLAAQALGRHGAVDVFFRIDRKCLHVDTDVSVQNATTEPTAASHLLKDTAGAQYRLVKPLPADTELNDKEVAWLVQLLDRTDSDDWFTEVARQNEEILALSSALLKMQAKLNEKEENSSNPSAA